MTFITVSLQYRCEQFAARNEVVVALLIGPARVVSRLAGSNTPTLL